MTKIKFVIFFLILPFSTLSSQNDTSTYDPIRAVVFLDSFVVTASRTGFDVNYFIKLVREDESFYQAFRNLRFTNEVV